MPNHSSAKKHSLPSPNTVSLLTATYSSNVKKKVTSWDSSISDLSVHKLKEEEVLRNKLLRLNKLKLYNVLTPIFNNLKLEGKEDNKENRNGNNKGKEMNGNSLSEEIKQYPNSNYISFSTPSKSDNNNYTKNNDKLPDLFLDYQTSNNNNQSISNNNNPTVQSLEEQVLNFQIPKIDFVSIYGESEKEITESTKSETINNKDDDEKLKLLDTIEKLKLRLDSYDLKQDIEHTFREKIFETVNTFNEQMKLMTEQMDQLKMENQTLKSKVRDLEMNKSTNISKEIITPFRSHHMIQNLPEEPSVAPIPYPNTPFRYATAAEATDNTDRYQKANSVKFSNPIVTPAPQQDNESSAVPTSILGRSFLRKPSPSSVSIDNKSTVTPVRLFQSPVPNEVIVKQDGSKFEC